MQDGGAARHGLADAAHEGSFLGTGEEPLAHFPRRGVDAGADVVEQFGHVLDLVEQDGRAEFVEEAAGIGAGAGLQVGILQQEVAGMREGVAQEVGFARPPRAGDDQGGIVPRGLQEGREDRPGDGLHDDDCKLKV